jgi:hypothetical protein
MERRGQAEQQQSHRHQERQIPVAGATNIRGRRVRSRCGRLFRRTKRAINFAHPPLKIVGQSIEPLSHRTVGALSRKATASDDLTLNSAKVV